MDEGPARRPGRPARRPQGPSLSRPGASAAPGYQPWPVGRRSLFQVEVTNREL